MDDIEFDTTEADEKVRKLMKLLSPQQIAKIGARAINRAATSARAEGSRAIRKDLILKARDVKEKMAITKARPTKLEAQIKFDNKPNPMSKFKPSSRKAGTSVRIKRSSGRGTIKGAFIIKQYKGEVFVRRYGPGGERNPRGPIRMLYGPSVASQADEAKPAMDKKAVETLGKRIPAEIDRAIKRANR